MGCIYETEEAKVEQNPAMNLCGTRFKNPDQSWDHPVLTVLTGEKYGSDTDLVPTDPKILYKSANVPWWVSLMRGRHRYIRTLIEGEVEELYNLENDPEELNNLALDPAHLDKLRIMREATISELHRTEAGIVQSLPAFSTPK